MSKKTLREKLKTDFVLLDGAFGTYAQALGLEDSYFEDRPGCMEYLALTKPDFITKIHSDYLDAGSDAVETNTFGGNILKLSEYGLSEKAYDINLESTKLARAACDAFSSDKHPRYVIGAMGPTGKLPSSSSPELGDVTYSELAKFFHDQALGIIDGGADALLIETGQDLLEMKAALAGAKKALKEKRKDLVLMAQCTLANNGRMLLGTDISAVAATLRYLGVDVIGVNCSTGPFEMEGSINFLSANCPTFISAIPNAGMPVEVDGKTTYPLAPDEMAGIIANFIKKYRIDVVGGCCGTTPEHISKIRKVLGKKKKHKIPSGNFCASFYKGFDFGRDGHLIKVGERVNTQGSRKMKDLLINNDYDGIIELGKAQETAGADILDVCSVLTERSTEKEDAVILIKGLAESVQVPLMIDSTDIDVIEEALKSYPGTAFINSANLEDGGKRARRIFELAREHGSFIVNLTIDENGMARTVEDKLKIAKRLYDIATSEYNIEPHRMLFDMLTFTLGTGEKEYADAAINTYKAIKQLKKKCPGALTVLGVSNISFGLSRNARKVLNMAFLHHAVQSGLDAAIINVSEIIEYKDISRKEQKLAEDLIFNKKSDALSKFIEYFTSVATDEYTSFTALEATDLKIEDRLKKSIFNRDKASVIPLIEEAIKDIPPEEILDNVLMGAMKEVGKKLDQGEMPLPYVLQSAEVMRKAIEYLEKFLPHDAIGKKGKVLLATVFGDVHDIGKNLVKMILQNNGFNVIDLGKQVSVERIVAEAKKNKVDVVGLSALLVSTARHMKTCVQALHEAGLDYPVLIGGAPTNTRFARETSTLENGSIYSGGVFYAKDAFMGLSIMRALADPDGKKIALEEYRKQFEEGQGSKVKGQEIGSKEQGGAKKTNDGMRNTKYGKVPTPPFYGPRAVVNIPVGEVFARLNEYAVFDLAWGVKIKDEKEKKRLFDEEYRPLLKEITEEAIRKKWLDLKIVYGYFKCRIFDEDMEILDGSGSVLEKIHFTRAKENPIALTDYFLNKEEGDDIVAFQAVTVGDNINSAIEELNDAKEFTRAFLLHGMSVHLAEALAAYTHDRVRDELNLGKDQGRRYSPGYPLWKNMEDQRKIFKILDVEKRINVRLTENCQMVPEQSTTAMIVYNDKAKY